MQETKVVQRARPMRVVAALNFYVFAHHCCLLRPFFRVETGARFHCFQTRSVRELLFEQNQCESRDRM